MFSSIKDKKAGSNVPSLDALPKDSFFPSFHVTMLNVHNLFFGQLFFQLFRLTPFFLVQVQ